MVKRLGFVSVPKLSHQSQSFSASPQPSHHLPQMRALSHQVLSIIFTEKKPPKPHKNKPKKPTKG